MKKQHIKFIIVAFLCFSFFPANFISSTSEVIRRVRILEPLTEAQLRLKDILDDPQAEITDQKLLVYGILDGLLERDFKYSSLYEQKAKQLLVKIYEEILDGKRHKLPYGIWEGKQGDLNARVLLKYVIEKTGWSVDENLPAKVSNWTKWFYEVGLSGMFAKFGNSPLAAFKLAYPEHFWDADNWDKPFLWFDHDFSPKGIWQDSGYDHYVKQLIRYKIEKEMGWLVDKSLPAKVSNWVEWFFYEVGLSGMLGNKFGNSPLTAFKFAYPEHFWDADNWDKPFLWFDHDFSPQGIWQDSGYDHYVKQLIRYKIEKEMGWPVDENLPGRVSGWRDWFNASGFFGSMLALKFGDSPLTAFKFTYAEKFADGTLKESDFGYLVPGRGAASIIYHPKKLGPDFKKSIDGIEYYFGFQFEGYSAGKLSDDFGGLFDSDGILVKVFPLVKDPAIIYINVVKEGLLWDVPDTFNKYLLARQQGRLRLSEEKALGMAKEQLGIDLFALSLRERSALAVVVELKGIKEVKEVKAFYEKAGLEGIKALVNLPHYQTAFELLQRYPVDAGLLFKTYNAIYNLGQEIKVIFGEQAPGYKAKPEDFPVGFLGTLRSLEYGVFSCLQEANNQILSALITGKVTPSEAKKAQQELLTILRVLKGYVEGKVRVHKEGSLDSETKEGFYYVSVDGHERLLRLITRTRGIGAGSRTGDGEACIRFTIEPHTYSELSFRIDRTYRPEFRRYIVTVDIEGTSLKKTGDYHHPLATAQFMELADEKTFADLVRAFRR